MLLCFPQHFWPLHSALPHKPTCRILKSRLRSFYYFALLMRRLTVLVLRLQKTQFQQRDSSLQACFSQPRLALMGSIITVNRRLTFLPMSEAQKRKSLWTLSWVTRAPSMSLSQMLIPLNIRCLANSVQVGVRFSRTTSEFFILKEKLDFIKELLTSARLRSPIDAAVDHRPWTHFR